MEREGRTLLCVVIVLAAFCGETVQAQDAKKSSAAAIKQYRAAVAFQNRQVFDLARDEWQTFLERYPTDPLAPSAQHYSGVCKFQLKDYPGAQAAFEKVVADHPDFKLLAETYLNLGLAQFNLGQQDKPALLDQAVTTFDTYLEKYPDEPQAPLALFYKAEALYSRDKKADALAAYSEFLTKFPEHMQRARALHGQGVALEELGKHKEARASYETFLEKHPDHALSTEIGMRLGETLAGTGQLADAEKRFAAAAGAEGFEFADHALQRQADMLAAQDKYAAAADLYASLPAKFPKSRHVNAATINAGKSYYVAKNFDKAREWLAKAREAGGEGAMEAAHWSAKSYLRDGKPAEALKIAEEALAGDAGKTKPDLLMDKADAIYEMPNRRKETVALYGEIASEFPDHAVAADAAYMAGFAALGSGQYKDALKHAEAFLAARADHSLAPDVMYVAAESNLQLKKYGEAAKLYAGLIEKYPSRPEIALWIVRQGLALLLDKKYAEVVAALSPKIESLKDVDAKAESQYLIGSSQFELKKYPEAVAALQASLAANPKWRQADETLLVLARAQQKTDDAKGALATLAKLIAEFPESELVAAAHYRQGEFQYAEGDYKQAAASYQQALDAKPDGPLAPHALFGLGWSQLSQQQVQPAAATMSQLIDKHADHDLAVRARYARAMARQQLKEFPGALEDAAAFLKSEPGGAEKSDALYVQGLSQAGLEKYDEAAKTFASILAADAGYAAADKVLYELAWAYQSKGDAGKAAETFARLGNEHADSPLAAESLYRVGEQQYQDKKYADAAKTYTAALERAGKSDLGEKSAHKLAWSHYQQEQYGQAAATFLSQVEAHPDGPLAADALVMAGESLFQQKKYQEALDQFTKALEKKPSSDDFTAIALLHAGQAAGQLEQWEQSLSLLERLTTEQPETPYKNEALYEQGWAKQNLGKTDEAFKQYETVADAVDTELGARARFMAGEIQFVKKDYEAAVRTFFRVMVGYGGPEAPEPFHRWQADATFEAARCLENLKRPEKAKELYQELIDKYPQSDKVPDAKAKLAG